MSFHWNLFPKKIETFCYSISPLKKPQLPQMGDSMAETGWEIHHY